MAITSDIGADMAIRDITYLKSRFENSDTPDQNDFGDWLDTMFQNAPPEAPIVIEFRGIILVDSNVPPGSLNFEVDISTVPDFTSFVKQASTLSSQDDWEYWNGTSLQPLPASGLAPAYQNEDVGLVLFTWTEAQRGTAYYVRYRSGFPDNWGDYRVARMTA